MSFIKIIVYFLKTKHVMTTAAASWSVSSAISFSQYFHSKCEIVFGTDVIGFFFHLDTFKTMLVLLLRVASSKVHYERNWYNTSNSICVQPMAGAPSVEKHCLNVITSTEQTLWEANVCSDSEEFLVFYNSWTVPSLVSAVSKIKILS